MQSAQYNQQNNEQQIQTQNRIRQIPSIPHISNQQSHPVISQQYSQYRIPMRHASSVKLLQSSGSNLTLNDASSRLSFFGQMSSNQSLQSMESSSTMISMQPSQELLPTQTFSVICNRIKYMVDPNSLMNASNKFRELIQPFLNDDQISSYIHLEVVNNDFTQRNMNNFLRLCQNLPTDVENSEMKEICEIAKMFQAEKIYDTGVNFVINNIDNDFQIPDSKYDGSDGRTWMFVVSESNTIHHENMDQLDFNDIEDDDENENENVNENVNDNVVEKDDDSKKNKKKDKKDKKGKDDKKDKKIKSVIYRVKVDDHHLKCPVYRLCLDDKIIYSAKQKSNNIYIANGNDVHINSDKDNHAARIYQENAKNNYIFIGQDQFKLSYVDSGKPNQLSCEISFPYKDRKIIWTPKTPKYNPLKGKYYLNFHGEYHHHAIHSKRNMVLQNPDGHTTFICRKVADDLFELEALPVINPLIIFSIGLSDIVGPYKDPLQA